MSITAAVAELSRLLNIVVLIKQIKSKAFGDDSPLYGAMGFVRKSECASGLTRKTKTPAN